MLIIMKIRLSLKTYIVFMNSSCYNMVYLTKVEVKRLHFLYKNVQAL